MDLTAERDRASDYLADLRRDHADLVAASRESNADDEHDPEGATIAFERQQLQALIDQAQQRVTDLDAALAQTDAGTYGLCQTCGEPIGTERLEARPSAQTCIACARG